MPKRQVRSSGGCCIFHMPYMGMNIIYVFYIGELAGEFEEVCPPRCTASVRRCMYSGEVETESTDRQTPGFLTYTEQERQDLVQGAEYMRL